MINLSRTQQVADIIHGSILYSGLEGAIISTPIFNRLHHILQSSLVYLTYSSNKVKRFEHSLGVMHLAGEMFYYSICNATDDDIDILMKITYECLSQWYSKKDFMQGVAIKPHYLDTYTKNNIAEAPIPKCSIYNMYFPHNIGNDQTFMYFLLFQSVRIAGLLHDIGHLPYSHIFEHATQQLYQMIKKLPNINHAQKEFLDIMRSYCEITEDCEHKVLHEEIGINLIKQIKGEVLKELNSCQSEQNLFALAVLDFAEKILCSSDLDETLFSDLHKIVAGMLDADRLDYCSRDAFCCGYRKDIIEYRRILPNYRLMHEKKSFLFCPALKNMSEVEELLERRWDIFSNINFHHRVHKHEIIFSEILAKVGFKELQNAEKIPDLQNGESLPLKLESVWALVKCLQSNNSLIDYSIIQLDDGWINTFLKHAFFEKYLNDYRNEDKFADDADWHMFDELISTKKHYVSAFKRVMDFTSFDEDFARKWIKQLEDNKLVSKADITVRRIYSLVKDKLDKTDKNKIEQTTQKPEWEFLECSLYSNLIISAIFPRNTNNFYQEVEAEMNKRLIKSKKFGMVHCILRPIDFSAGLSITSMVHFWDTNNKCQNFMLVSKLKKKMEMDQGLKMPFHLYYLPKRGAKINMDKFHESFIDVLVKISEKYI